MKTVMLCISLGTASAAYAGTLPFNPDHLDLAQLTTVTQVCQTVLGLTPDERLQGGNRSGDDRLDFWTSHYQGCIIGLSDSLRMIGDAGTQGAPLPLAGGRFMSASPHEIMRRERLACSSLGVNVPAEEINRCVNGLSEIFFAIDHPIE
jgi:hypothetical protein